MKHAIVPLTFHFLYSVCVMVVGFLSTMQVAQGENSARTIVLVAGETAKVDVMGHHDYLAGCQCLKSLLSQSSGVECVSVEGGWPSDEALFEKGSSIVFYTDGGGKQAFLQSARRVALIEQLVQRGVGVVMIHQAVDFPDEYAAQGKRWLGGVYLKDVSGRGHWDSAHVDFPAHPITRGVEPWKIKDGWLNELAFVEGLRGVTPLVWSGKEYAGSRAGLDQDIVGWAYDRPDGGRSFSFTGLDAHSAWSLPGVRQLMVNGILWTAGIDIDSRGAPAAVTELELEAMLTPREPKKPTTKAKKP